MVYMYALGKAHMRSTPSLRSFFPPMLPLKQFQCWSGLIDDGPFSSQLCTKHNSFPGPLFIDDDDDDDDDDDADLYSAKMHAEATCSMRLKRRSWRSLLKKFEAENVLEVYAHPKCVHALKIPFPSVVKGRLTAGGVVTPKYCIHRFNHSMPAS